LGSKFTKDKEKFPHEVFPLGTNGSSLREKLPQGKEDLL
jgi:hypothetical protein